MAIFPKNKDALHQHILLSTLPGHLYWKSTNGTYLGGNKTFLKTLHFNSSSQLLNKNDSELLGDAYAPAIMENDQFVISKKAELFLEEESFDAQNNKVIYLSKKTPLYDQDKQLIGVVGLSMPLINGLYADIGEQLVDAVKNSFNTQNNEGIMDIYKLTKRQIECIYYLLRGCTAKQIGSVLHISCRTVESYLDDVKTKLRCNNRSELINKLINFHLRVNN